MSYQKSKGYCLNPFKRSLFVVALNRFAYINSGQSSRLPNLPTKKSYHNIQEEEKS